ncbi:MAG: PAS domain S-box protein, partial [Proteobacteria bacterium]
MMKITHREIFPRIEVSDENGNCELLLDRHSSMIKLVRVTALVLRFIDVARKKRKITSNCITHAEYLNAQSVWIKYHQAKYFSKEIAALNITKQVNRDSPVIKMTPFIDGEGIMRVGGRIKRSTMPFDTKHPIILSSEGRFSHLIAVEAHAKTLHGGNQLCIQYIRSRFWMITVRKAIKRVTLKCVRCFRHRKEVAEQLMGDLPAARIVSGHPFEEVGVDYCGPILIKERAGITRKQYKAYIAVFVCMKSKAVYLDLVTDLTTDAFIAADEQFSITIFNKTAARIFGLPVDMMIGRSLLQIIPDLNPLSSEKIYTQLLTTGKWKGETTLYLSEDQKIAIELAIFANGQEKTPGFAAIIKQSGNEPSNVLNLKELIYNKPFFNALAEGLVVQDARGEVIVYNTAAERITGLSRDQIVDANFLSKERRCFHEDGSFFSWETFPAVIANKTGIAQQNVVLGWESDDGSLRWININSKPVNDENGTLIGTVTSFTDITAIKSAREELKRSEEKWRSVINNSKNGLFLIDKNYTIILVNEDAVNRQTMMPNAPQIKEGMCFLDILPEHRKKPVKAALDSVLGGDSVEYEVVYTRSDNQDVWLLANYTPVRDSNGEITSICFTVNDITALKSNESALYKSEQRWKFALDGAGDGVW